MTADDQVTGAFHRAGEFAKDGEIVALDGGSGKDSGFVNHHIAARLDAAVPIVGNVVVEQADVAAAFRALAQDWASAMAVYSWPQLKQAISRGGLMGWSSFIRND